MRIHSLLVAISAFFVTIFVSTSASAGWVGQVPFCFGCGPTQNAEFFIYNDTGAGAFDAAPITGLPAGWTSTRVNDDYALATGTSSSLSAWFEHYAGDQTQSLEIDVFFWAGDVLNSTISFAANYVWSNGNWSLNCQSFGAGCDAQFDMTGVRYDRSSTVPEPATAALVGLALLGMVLVRRRASR